MHSSFGNSFKACRFVVAAGLVSGAVLASAPRAHAATVSVNTLTPDTAGDGKCGFVEAVQAVNQGSTYRNCTYTANGQADRIVFTVSGTHNLDGVSVTRSVEIAGLGTTSTTLVTSNGFCGICSSGAASGGSMMLWLRNLTLKAATSSVFGVRVSVPSLFVTLALDGVLVRGYGVGVYGGGPNVLTQVTSSTIESNAKGLAIDFGTLQVNSSTFQYNTGGGISIYQDTAPHYSYVANSLIRNNTSDSGAGIYVEAEQDPASSVTLAITGTTLSGNQATTDGGGLRALASTSIASSTFDGNTAGDMGGGAFFEERANGNPVYVNVTATTFKNNQAAYGAGLTDYGPSDGQRVKASFYRSTFGPNNVATADGGGIYSLSQIDWAENLTIHGNKAARGGGLFHNSGGESHVFHSTITANVATTSNGGGGLWLTTGNPIYSYNVIAENKAGAGLTANNVVTSNPYLSAAYNLLDDVSGVAAIFPTASSGGTNIVANPQLGAFGFYGGETYVRPLLASSPGLDVIPPAVSDPVPMDQRGFLRPIDGNLNGTASFDIGSVEMNAAATQYEAEALTVAAQTGEALTLENNASYSGGQGRVKQANLNGSLTLQTGTIQPGTYGVIVWFKKASNAGKFQLAVGSSAGSTSNLGTAQDAYNGSAQWTKVNLGTITVTSAGARYFKLTATSKNGASGGYWMFIDAIQLYKTN